MFKRRAKAAPPPSADLGAGSVVVFADPDGPSPQEERAEAWGSLRRIVAEALILQDSAEELLIGLRDQRHLGGVAPRCGTLMARFIALEQALPSCGDVAMDRHTSALSAILDHHVLMLDSARALLAAEWRSERLSEQLDRLDGLGAPARRLEAVRQEILGVFPG